MASVRNTNFPWIGGVEFELPDEAFRKLNALERGVRYNDPLNWGFDIFDEHTPEEVQQAMDEWVAKNWKKHNIEQ